MDSFWFDVNSLNNAFEKVYSVYVCVADIGLVKERRFSRCYSRKNVQTLTSCAGRFAGMSS